MFFSKNITPHIAFITEYCMVIYCFLGFRKPDNQQKPEKKGKKFNANLLMAYISSQKYRIRWCRPSFASKDFQQCTMPVALVEHPPLRSPYWGIRSADSACIVPGPY